MLLRQLRCIAALAALLAISGQAAAEDSLPKLYTHQTYVEEAMRTSTLAISDPLAVFDFVFKSLPDRVKVYPTENYYYFYFVDRHVRYAGNIRLDVVDRDEGKVHFAYFEDLAEWKDEDPVAHVVLDETHGVKVEKVARLSYRITYGGKSVLFELNDLSYVNPPPDAVSPDETYLGPIFDDSAIRFFLVFNRKLKLFHYILDETEEVADQFIRLPDTDRIIIGKRTGFAFYRDAKLNRRILIGVFEGNSRVNNYFDGPFDQLPDNFIEGEALRDAILAVEPQLKGRIDRLGISPTGDDRYLIGPYRHYRYDEDLLVFDTCANDKRIPPANYYACFVFNEDTGQLQAETMRPPARRTRGGPNRARIKRR